MAELSTTRAPDGTRSAHPVVSALLVLGGAALFGTVGTAQALGPDVPPESLAAARMLLSGVLLVLATSAMGRFHGIVNAVREPATWFAGLGQAAFNLCFLAAMKEAGVAVGTLVAIGATPVVTGLLTRQVTRVWLLATSVAVTGLVLLVIGQQGTPSAPSAMGVVLALGAAASYATYIIAGNAAERRGLETQSFLAAAFVVAALLTMPWLVAGDLLWLDSLNAWLLLGYLVVVPTILSYSLFNRGLRGVRSSTASTLGLVEPVVAAALAYAVLGERLGASGLLGAAMLVLGLLLIVRTASPGRVREDTAEVPVRPLG